MTVGELKDLLDDYDDDLEVRLAHQPRYPLESTVAGVATDAGDDQDDDEEDDPKVLYILEGLAARLRRRRAVATEQSMNDHGFARCLLAVLTDELDVNESFDPDGIRDVETFEEVGMLTTDQGLVVTMDDGAEFQVTIVRSRRGRNDGGDDV